MIVYSFCNSCFRSFNITVMPGDVELLDQLKDPEGVTCKCPRLCGGRINIVNIPELCSVDLDMPVPITVTELYKAVHGLGLPEEIVRDPLVVEALLKSSKVVNVELESYNNGVYLHELVLENGAIIHLSSGSRGACVLKITKEG